MRSFSTSLGVKREYNHFEVIIFDPPLLLDHFEGSLCAQKKKLKTLYSNYKQVVTTFQNISDPSPAMNLQTFC